MAVFKVQSKMAAAFVTALETSVREGHNPGRIGKRILTNKHSGVGLQLVRVRDEAKPRPVLSILRTAETAGEGVVA